MLWTDNKSFRPGPINTNWGSGPIYTNRGPGPVNTNWGPGLGDGAGGQGQDQGRGPSRGSGAGKYKDPGNNLNFREDFLNLCVKNQVKRLMLQVKRLMPYLGMHHKYILRSADFRNLSLLVLSSCVDISQLKTKCLH